MSASIGQRLAPFAQKTAPLLQKALMVCFFVSLLLPSEKEWINYQPVSKNYTVAFPEKPTEKSKQSDTTTTLHLAIADYDEDLRFVIGEAKLNEPCESATERSAILKAESGSAVEGSKLLSRKDIEVSGVPGIESIFIQADGKMLKSWYLIANNSIYSVMVRFLDKQSASRPEAEKFLNSFKLTNGETATPLAPAEALATRYFFAAGFLLGLASLAFRFLGQLGTT